MTEDEALLGLLRLLKDRVYRFVAVTPATHARVLTRPCERPDLRDIFGWSRPFEEEQLDPPLLDCLRRSDMIEHDGAKLRSRVRVASLGDDLFLHSAYPTVQADAVFFGPDTYRFVRFLRQRIPLLSSEPEGLVDMGTGSGAGAVVAARLLPAARFTGIDINPAALRLAGINAAAAGAALNTDLSSNIPPGADLVIANPPYIMDSDGRAYRDGRELLGGQLALDWARQALESLVPGGTMLLYTGASVVDEGAPLIDALVALCAATSADVDIEETDPDVFGEELDQPTYADVERIAVICATIRKAD